MRDKDARPLAYVANQGSGTVSVIDTAINPPQVVATVPVGTNPAGVAVTPDGTHAYVTNFFSNNVSVIDSANNTVAATVDVGDRPNQAAVTPDGKYVYVTNSNSNNVSVITTASMTAVDPPISVGVSLQGLPSPPMGSASM
jgi:YVTN family beta-propeller protein